MCCVQKTEGDLSSHGEELAPDRFLQPIALKRIEAAQSAVIRPLYLAERARNLAETPRCPESTANW